MISLAVLVDGKLILGQSLAKVDHKNGDSLYVTSNAKFIKHRDTDGIKILVHKMLEECDDKNLKI